MTHPQYQALAPAQNPEGEARCVGFEFEFSGLTLEQAAQVVIETYAGEICSSTQAEMVIRTELGEFSVEIDWDFLKEQSEKISEEKKWLSYLAELASMVVPIEIVCPPIPWQDIHKLETLTSSLGRHGAQGTDTSLLAAYGLHINTEVASFQVADLHAYLKAFTLLQWWLDAYHQTDVSRRMTPYVDFFAHEYIRGLCSRVPDTTDELIDDYLQHNATRNRALDMLPLFSLMDAKKVENALQDTRIKARPTFHYRLPNCRIDRFGWDVSHAWNGWVRVERLASTPTLLNSLGAQYLDHEPLLGSVDKKQWLRVLEQCMKNPELA